MGGFSIGKVLCPTHGGQEGPHTCDHICEIVYGHSLKSRPCDTVEPINFQIDYFDDGAVLLDYLACEACAALCEAKDGDVFGFEHFDENHVLATWPPTCEMCVGAWLNDSRTPSS